MLNLARNAAVGQHAHVAIFSLEMAGEQLAQRLLAAEAEVDSARLRLGLHSEVEESRIMHAHGVLSQAEVYVDDSAALHIPELRAKAMRLKRDEGLDLIVVDYLQLVHGSRSDNRVQEIGFITRSLKELARELDLPIIAGSQLSRATDQRQPHIPMLSDLRESGSIEQDADVVLFIYREEVYVNKDEWSIRSENVGKPPGQFPAGKAISLSPSTATAPPARSRSASATRSRSSRTSSSTRASRCRDRRGAGPDNARGEGAWGGTCRRDQQVGR